MMEPSGPYRPEDQGARYICIVCFQTASKKMGACARCGGAPLQRVDDNAELIETLRERAKRKKARPERIQFLSIIVGAVVCAIVVDGLLIGTGVFDVKAPKHAGYSGRWGAGGELFLYPFLMWLGFIFVLTYVFKWTGAFKRSIEAAEKFNPDGASVEELLAWLGIQID